MRDKLKKIRKKIDKTDRKIQKLLEKREILIQKAGKFKKANKLKIEDVTREKEVISRIKNPYVKAIFKEIIRVSKEFQSKL